MLLRTKISIGLFLVGGLLFIPLYYFYTKEFKDHKYNYDYTIGTSISTNYTNYTCATVSDCQKCVNGDGLPECPITKYELISGNCQDVNEVCCSYKTVRHSGCRYLNNMYSCRPYTTVECENKNKNQKCKIEVGECFKLLSCYNYTVCQYKDCQPVYYGSISEQIECRDDYLNQTAVGTTTIIYYLKSEPSLAYFSVMPEAKFNKIGYYTGFIIVRLCWLFPALLLVQIVLILITQFFSYVLHGCMFYM